VYRLHPDYSVQLNKDLMDSATQTSEDPQTIVYKIKQNAAWSDGTPVSADDLEYLWRNLNGSVKGNDVASTTGYDQIESVEGSDNGKTVTVVFKEPFTDWKSLFYGLLPARYMAEVPGGWNTGLDKNPERIPRQRPLPHRAVVRASRLQLQERAPGRPGGPQGHRHRPQHPRDREPDRQAVHRQGPARLGNRIWLPGQRYYQDHFGQYGKGDTAGATALLEEAGYAKGADGIYAKDGRPLSLRISTTAGNQLRETREQLIFAQAVREVDEARSAELGNQIDQQMTADLATIPLYAKPTYLAVRDRFANVGDNATQEGPFWNSGLWAQKAA
jgi:ABC-type transport system substrate-binding protein